MAERVRRSVEERIAEIDQKIAAHEANIAALKKRKDAILNPKPRKRLTKKAKVEMILKNALKQGLNPDDIARMLNVPLPDFNNEGSDSSASDAE